MFSTELTSRILPCAIILTMANFTNARIILLRRSNAYVNPRLWENTDRLNQNSYEQKIINPLTSDGMMGGERISKTLTPQARRFLFSPTIQNTITNLNQNSNNQEVSKPEETEHKSTYGYVNRRTGAMEYDIRTSRPIKICITLE